MVGDVHPLHTGRNVQALGYKAVFALVDAKATVDRCGLDVSRAGQGDLAWLLSPVLSVEDVVRVPTGVFRRSQIQGIEASDVVLWRRGRNLDLPREGCEVLSFGVNGWHSEHLLTAIAYHKGT